VGEGAYARRVGSVTVPTQRVSTRRRWLLIGFSILAFAVLILVSLHLMKRPTPPAFQNFGSVNTRYGAATLYCGGPSTSTCGASTAVRFAVCSEQLKAALTPAANEKLTDLIQQAVGRTPPSGLKFLSYSCGGAPIPKQPKGGG
jgi:hypothetical protein